MIKKILMLSILVFLSPSANAVPLTFDFSGGSSSTSGYAGNTRSFSDTTNTMSLVATAWSFEDWVDNSSYPSSAYLGHYGSGLGVTNCDNATNPSDYCDRDQHVVDNGGNDFDYVKFLFDHDVTVVSVGITVFNGYDHDVGDNNYGDADLSYVFGLRPSNESDWLYEYAEGPVGGLLTIPLAGGFPTDQFRLGAYLGGTNDDFKITSLTVETTVETAEVPEPATPGLIGLGLLGMAAARRNRKA